MTARIALFVACLLGLASLGFAADAPPTLDAKSSLEQILSALEARGNGLNDFSADVTLVQSDTLGGGASTMTGKVWYQARAKGDERIRVVFDKRSVGKKITPNYKLEYLLDKGWLIERDHLRKIQVDRQVLKPGQKVNLLKLGEGPFPLPIGQPQAEVLKQFEVKKIDADKDDPANTVHIQLTPRKENRLSRRFKLFDVWVDVKTHFPRKIETIDPNQTEVRATEFANLQINQGLGEQPFELEKVGTDWTRRAEEMAD